MRSQIEISTNPVPLTYSSPDTVTGAAPYYSALAQQTLRGIVRKGQDYYNRSICWALQSETYKLTRAAQLSEKDTIISAFQTAYLQYSFDNIAPETQRNMLSVFGFDNKPEEFVAWLSRTDAKVNPNFEEYHLRTESSFPTKMMLETSSKFDTNHTIDNKAIYGMIRSLCCYHGYYALLRPGTVTRLIFQNHPEGAEATLEEILSQVNDFMHIGTYHEYLDSEQIASFRGLVEELNTILSSPRLEHALVTPGSEERVDYLRRSILKQKKTEVLNIIRNNETEIAKYGEAR